MATTSNHHWATHRTAAFLAACESLVNGSPKVRVCCTELQYVAVCCSVLQCVAAAVLAACEWSVNGSPKVRVCCRETLQHTVTHCNTLQHIPNIQQRARSSQSVPPEPATPSINTHHSRICLPVFLPRLPVPLCMRMRAHLCASVCTYARPTHTRAWYVMKRRCVQHAKRRVL